MLACCPPHSVGRWPVGREGSWRGRAEVQDPSARYAGTSPTSLGRNAISCLLADRGRLAVLPDVDVVDRVLDVALLVEGERAHGRIIGAAAQRCGHGGRIGRLGL